MPEEFTQCSTSMVIPKEYSEANGVWGQKRGKLRDIEQATNTFIFQIYEDKNKKTEYSKEDWDNWEKDKEGKDAAEEGSKEEYSKDDWDKWEKDKQEKGAGDDAEKAPAPKVVEGSIVEAKLKGEMTKATVIEVLDDEDD